jgi:peroxiredoxin
VYDAILFQEDGMVRRFMGMLAIAAGVATAQGQVADSAESIRPLEPGLPVPSVWLQTVRGQSVDLNEAVHGMPSVVVFYRGGWCPYCLKQLSGLQQVHDQLRELGFQVIAISPDPPEKLRETIQKNALGFTLLSDNGFAAATAFGLAFRLDPETEAKYQEYKIPLYSLEGQAEHLLPVPAVFLVSPEGVITFAHSDPDYTVRLDPAQLLEAAQATAAP